jgi:hypothetical protein
MEVDEAPIKGDVAPFLGEDAVMMIFRRHPSPVKHRGLDPSMQTPSRSNQGWGAWKCKGMIFFLYINICNDTYIYVHHIHAIKKRGRNNRWGGLRL